MVDTLYYLKKGGRITPAAAALGTLLKLKPVLQIQGEKLDAFAKARTVKRAKNLMIEAMKHDFAERFHDPEGKSMHLEMAYTYDLDAAEAFRQEVQEAFPGLEIHMDPLSLERIMSYRTWGTCRCLLEEDSRAGSIDKIKQDNIKTVFRNSEYGLFSNRMQFSVEQKWLRCFVVLLHPVLPEKIGDKQRDAGTGQAAGSAKQTPKKPVLAGTRAMTPKRQASSMTPESMGISP